MTTYNKQTLQTFFQTSDVPNGSDYANLIDSQVNIVETSVQNMGGPLSTPQLIASQVSAGNGVFTGTLQVNGQFSAQNANFGGNVYVSGAFSANNFNPTNITTTNLTAASANITNLISTNISSTSVSATTVNTTTVTAGTVYSTNGMIAGVGIVSAAGTTQGTAASLANVVNRGKGIADGVTTGFTPLTNKPGLVQYLFNEGVSANLWPPTGGFINGLAQNAAFPLVASAMVTIVHLTASAYAVK